jgi:signal transduction histidine kinase
MQGKYLTTIFLLFGLLPAVFGQGEQVVELYAYENMEGLQAATYFFWDTAQSCTYEQAKLKSFAPLPGNAQAFRSGRVYWGKITLVNKTGEVTDWVVHTGYNSLTDLYVEQHGRVIHKQSGELLPTSLKDIKEVRKDCVFKIRLLPEQPTTLYLRVEGRTGYAPAIEPRLETEESWENRDRQYYVMQSLFFGSLLMMMCYNLAVFFTTRERAYGYYAAFICAGLLYFAWFHGFVHLFFLPEWPLVNLHFWLFSIATPILYLQFIRLLLDLPHAYPSIDRYVRYTVRANLAVLAVALPLSIAMEMELAVKLVNTTLVADALVFAVILFQLFTLDNTLIQYFLAGVAFFLVSSFLGVFSYTYLQWQEAVYAVQIGVIGQIMLHSLGLGHKMRQVERERQAMQHRLILQLEENHRLQEDATRKLEDKVKARTAEIERQKDQIAEQNEELRALNEEKNSLIRIVAHDLKSPLNRITGLVNVIKLDLGRLSDEQQSFLELISETSGKLRNMVMRILDADAIEGHDPKLSLEVLDLAGLAQARSRDFVARAKEKYLDLQWKAPEEATLHVKIDQNYFEQVFENLLSNAVKFSPKGTRIEVGAYSGEGKAVVYVQDEGPGLTEDDKSKLFKKYQKLSAQPTGGEQSTGLGLSIVKRYVELLGGEIWCESEAGKGATFFMAFPLSQCETVPA